MGVPAVIFGLEALITVLLLGGGMHIFIPLILPIHYASKWMHARDDGAFSAMFRYASEKDVYDPWSRPRETVKRPEGFGKGLQC